MKLKVLVGLTVFATAAALGLTYLLLPKMGINGVGVAWLATQGIIASVIVATLLRGRRATSTARTLISKK